jgi:hypothetical protein
MIMMKLPKSSYLSLYTTSLTLTISQGYSTITFFSIVNTLIIVICSSLVTQSDIKLD